MLGNATWTVGNVGNDLGVVVTSIPNIKPKKAAQLFQHFHIKVSDRVKEPEPSHDQSLATIDFIRKVFAVILSKTVHLPSRHHKSTQKIKIASPTNLVRFARVWQQCMQ